MTPDIPSRQDIVIARLGGARGARITPDGRLFVAGVEREVDGGSALYDALVRALKS